MYITSGNLIESKDRIWISSKMPMRKSYASNLGSKKVQSGITRDVSVILTERVDTAM